MRTLDRYVSAQFLKTALFALLAFSAIFILIDMIENLDDFLDENVPTHIIVLYYAYFLPRILGLMVPLALLLGALFVVGRMSNANEVTIVTCAGVPLFRFMVPFLAIGAVVSVGMLVFDGWMVPRINAARLGIERAYLKKNVQTGTRSNLFFEDTGHRIVSIEWYDEGSASARGVSIQQFGAADPTVMERRIDAASMRWNPASGDWTAVDGMVRSFGGTTGESVRRFDSLRVGKLVLTPAVIVRMQQKPEELSLDDFREYIRRQRRAGSDIARLLVDYDGKIAFPFASVIVVFFGVPFASIRRRSGLSLQFGVSLLICFVYLVGQKLSQVTGYNGSVPAWIAAWLPNAVFFLAGLVVVFRVRR